MGHWSAGADGVDVSRPEGLAVARQKKSSEPSPGYVRDAAEILEEVLAESGDAAGKGTAAPFPLYREE